jgi:hypothetical protein
LQQLSEIDCLLRVTRDVKQLSSAARFQARLLAAIAGGCKVLYSPG